MADYEYTSYSYHLVVNDAARIDFVFELPGYGPNDQQTDDAMIAAIRGLLQGGFLNAYSVDYPNVTKVTVVQQATTVVGQTIATLNPDGTDQTPNA